MIPPPERDEDAVRIIENAATTGRVELGLAAITVRLAVLTERVTGTERARVLDTAEIQRRLGELNHAHDKQVKDQATYIERRVFETTMADWSKWRDLIQADVAAMPSNFVARQLFDAHVKEKDIWRESVNSQLSGLMGRSVGTGSSRVLFFQVLAAVMAALSLYLLFTRSGHI